MTLTQNDVDAAVAAVCDGIFQTQCPVYKIQSPVHEALYAGWVFESWTVSTIDGMQKRIRHEIDSARKIHACSDVGVIWNKLAAIKTDDVTGEQKIGRLSS